VIAETAANTDIVKIKKGLPDEWATPFFDVVFNDI